MNVIQMDTREKAGKKDHITGYFDRHGVKYIRSKLYVGDYTRLDNQTICVDVKQNLQEVYSNVIGEHRRFCAECIRAQDAGIKLIVLVEEPRIGSVDDVRRWVNPRVALWKRGKLKQQRKTPPVSSERLSAIMKTISERYGVLWRFCPPEDTGRSICGLLGIESGKD